MVNKLVAALPESTVIDRRQRPTHGYRAVHVIATLHGKSIEIQIRTRLQDLWAQLSEKMADEVGRDLKYGGGPGEERRQLALLSEAIKRVEIGKLNRIQSSQLKKLRSTVSKRLKQLIE
jgi:ppGpp synthetase/RelA/SpoT-type nucleotidyltranferase